jgi:hypothetical protein
MALTAVAVLGAAFIMFALSAREVIFNTVTFVILGYVVALCYRHYSKYSDFRFGSDNRAALIELSILVISTTVGIFYFINVIAE